MKYIKINFLYFTIIILFFLLLFNNLKHNERFLGYGKVFSVHSNPSPKCKYSNDCFPGYYYRSQKYQNICEPKDTRLTRERKNLIDNCSKSLEGNMMLEYPK